LLILDFIMESSKQFAFNIANIHELPKFLVEDTPLYVNTHNNNMEGQDYVNSEFGDKDYNFDLAENIEDESVVPDLPIPFYPNRNLDFGLSGPTRTDSPSYERGGDEEESGLSSDSLAFTITYCSVFTITLVYVAIKLVKRWRLRTEGTLPSTTHQISWCGHAHCSQVHHSGDPIPHQYLPYAGLGSGFIPSMIRLPHGVNSVPLAVNATAVHATAACNDGCDSCQRLAQPPPSYTKLFLEEQPPTYGDAVAKQEEVEEVAVSEHVECAGGGEDSAVVKAEYDEDSGVVGEVVDIRDSVVVVIEAEDVDEDDQRKRPRS